MLFYHKSFVLNEVFLAAFPRMLAHYTLIKVKNLEKELANEKCCWATKKNGSGVLTAEILRENNLFCFHSIRTAAATQKLKMWM